jgi:hypothetical protein
MAHEPIVRPKAIGGSKSEGRRPSSTTTAGVHWKSCLHYDSKKYAALRTAEREARKKAERETLAVAEKSSTDEERQNPK